MKKDLLLLLITAVGCIQIAAMIFSSNLPAQVRLEEKKDKVEVWVNERLVTTYIYPEELKKPVLYPVLTPGGTEVTRGFPVNPRPGDRVDHPHHVGIWFNHGDVNDLDFWNNSTSVKPERKDRYGSIVHRKVIRAVNKDEYSELLTSSSWVDPKGRSLMEEKTRYRFTAGEGFWAVERMTSLTAKGDTIRFEDSKEGMFAIRLRQELELPGGKQTIRIAEGGKPSEAPVDANLASGTYRTSEGLDDKEAWGKQARWVRLSGMIEGKDVSVIIFDHKENLNAPAYWHARDYGLFSVNNLGSKSYNKETTPTLHILRPGESLVFNHKIIIHEGSFPSDKEIQAWYTDWTARK